MNSTETPIKKFVKRLLSPLSTTSLYSWIHAFSMKRDILSQRLREPEVDLLPFLVSPGDIVLDVGANYGMYSYPLSELVGDSGAVYAFEPIPYTFSTFTKVCKFLNLKNVHSCMCAIGNETGTCNLQVPLQNGGHLMGGQAFISTRDDQHGDISSQVRWSKTVTYSSSIDKLDSFLPNNLHSKVSLIKLDIEGAEYLALLGASSILKQSLPSIVIEINPWFLEGFGFDINVLLSLLLDMGYLMFKFDVSRNKLMPTTSSSSIIESNYIFLHPERVSRKTLERLRTTIAL